MTFYENSPDNIITIAEALQSRFGVSDVEAIDVANTLLELVGEDTDGLEQVNREEDQADEEMTTTRPDQKMLEGAVYATAKRLFGDRTGSTKSDLADLLKASDSYDDEWAIRAIGKAVVDHVKNTKPSESLGKIGQDGVPDKVKEIAEAIARENPDFSMGKKYRMAWSTYKKMKNKKKASINRHLVYAAMAGISPQMLRKISSTGSIPGDIEKIAGHIRWNDQNCDHENAYKIAWESYSTKISNNGGASSYGAESSPPDGFTPTGDIPRKKVSQKGANFRKGGGTAKRRCGTCRFFRPGSKTCEVVKGSNIEAGDISKIWAPKRAEKEAGIRDFIARLLAGETAAGGV